MTVKPSKYPWLERPRGPNGSFLSKNAKPPPQKKDFIRSSLCFDKQLAFVEDPARFVTACCSRRAGKTEGCAIDLLYTANAFDGIVCGYITLTARLAKKIIWRKLKKLNKQYNLGGIPNEAELSITLPNDSMIYLSGCKTEDEIDKFLGVPLKLLYLDEVQGFRKFIGDLIDRAIAPALMDYAGSLKLIGTPGLLKAGYFWEALQNPAYSHHSWTFWDNPYIAEKSGKPHQELLDAELARRGVQMSDPTVQREWYGLWVIDDESRVFKYNPELNDYKDLPVLTEFVVAVDIGHDDADAIAVIGWPKHERQCYLVEELVVPQQGITELADQIESKLERYNPLKVVMDTGGLGKKIAVELQRRRALPIQAAEKSRKQEYIELLNDAMRTRTFMAKTTSRFAEDTFKVEWDHDKTTSERRVVKEDPHSDICDAVLYGYREALHWLAEPEVKKINPRDPEQWIKHTQKVFDDYLQKQIDTEEEEQRLTDQMNIMGLEQEEVLSYFINKRKK